MESGERAGSRKITLTLFVASVVGSTIFFEATVALIGRYTTSTSQQDVHKAADWFAHKVELWIEREVGCVTPNAVDFKHGHTFL